MARQPVGCKPRSFWLHIIHEFDDTTPIRVLAAIDFAEIQHWPLHYLAASTALALHNAPVTVLFAVLNPSCESQVHDDGF
jgi:hypothetical protein